MSIDETANDATIAQLLAEEFDDEPILFIPSKEFKIDDVPVKNPNCITIDEDAEMAFILQIEEIVLSENKINGKAIKVNDFQLEKTHADMTKALQPTEQTDLMTRILGMFVTIQTRYANCQAKNQVLIDQIQKLSVQFYPLLMSFKTQGKSGISKAAVPTLALGLITNVLQGKTEVNDAKEMMINMLQIWNESNVWYEFFEQLVYILVAITVPSFAQGAMGKIMGKISSSK